MSTSAASLLSAPTLVVDQKTKIFELKNQYKIFDENSQQLGSVEQVNQGVVTMIARIASDWDVMLPVTLEVRDQMDQPLLTLKKPFFRMTVIVSHANGPVLGSIKKKIKLGKARFELLDPGGSPIGEINAQNWRAKDFAITSSDGRTIAEVNKQWKGLAREMFTDADKYIVRVMPDVNDPMRSLALGAALAIDVVMKQKDYGSSDISNFLP